jgi:hypothetical protein
MDEDYYLRQAMALSMGDGAAAGGGGTSKPEEPQVDKEK